MKTEYVLWQLVVSSDKDTLTTYGLVEGDSPNKLDDLIKAKLPVDFKGSAIGVYDDGEVLVLKQHFASNTRGRVTNIKN